jgi:hypothetical protein
MDTYTQAGTPKRQYRGLEEKRRIVEETLVEGASVALVSAWSQRQPCFQLAPSASSGTTGRMRQRQAVAGQSDWGSFAGANSSIA